MIVQFTNITIDQSPGAEQTVSISTSRYGLNLMDLF